MPRNSQTLSRHLVSIDQAAEYASVSAKTIRRRISDGSLRGFRLGKGRTIRVDLNDVEQLLHEIPTAGGDAA